MKLENDEFFFIERNLLNEKKKLLCYTVLFRIHWRISGTTDCYEAPAVRFLSAPDDHGTELNMPSFQACIGMYQWQDDNGWIRKKGKNPWWAAGAKLAEESFPANVIPSRGFHPPHLQWTPYQGVTGKGRKPDIDRKFKIWTLCFAFHKRLKHEEFKEAALVEFLNRADPSLRLKVGSLRSLLHSMGITLQK